VDRLSLIDSSSFFAGGREALDELFDGFDVGVVDGFALEEVVPVGDGLDELGRTVEVRLDVAEVFCQRVFVFGCWRDVEVFELVVEQGQQRETDVDLVLGRVFEDWLLSRTLHRQQRFEFEVLRFGV